MVCCKDGLKLVRWLLGATHGERIVPAPELFLSVAINKDGSILTSDPNRDGIFHVNNGTGKLLAEGEVECPMYVQVTSSGAIFVCDHSGGKHRVMKFHNGAISKMHEFEARGYLHMCVAEDEVVYTSHTEQHVVKRWEPGSSEGTIAAGGNGQGSGLNQLDTPGGIALLPDGALLIADSANHRVMKWKVGSNEGEVVAGGHGAGEGAHQLNRPTDVVMESNTLFVCDSGNSRVTQWGPPPHLEM